MKPMTRALTVGLLGVSLLGVAPGVPALATTDAVSGSGLLPAPTGLSPNDGTVRKTVTLDWTGVTGATSYAVEVGQDSTWSSAPVYKATATATELVLPVSLPHGTYVWRVAAVKAGVVGHWTSETVDPEFTRGWTDAPTTLTPTGAVGARPEFSWTPVPFASAYEVQVTDQPFVQPTGVQELAPGNVDTCFTARTRVTFFTEHAENGESNPGVCVSTLLGSGAARYWRVRALDRFTGEGAEYSTDPAAHGVSDAAPAGEPDDTIASDCKGDTGGGCSPAAASEFGAWSEPVTFTATGAAPAGAYDPSTPVVVHALTTDPDGLCAVDTPSPGITTCQDFPTLSWDAAPGAARYRVTVALDAAMSNVQRILDTSGLQWTPTDSWPDATSSKGYYVTVQACDAGQCGTAGTPVSFRKSSPRSVITSAVPPVTGELTLTWQSYADALAAATGQDETQDAYAYHLEVARADHPYFDVVVDHQLLDQASYTPQVAYGNGDFVWRVQAVDSAGHGLPWSAVQAFSRDATPPTVTGVVPSSAVGVLQPLRVTFSEPVTGVSASSLVLSPAATSTVTVTSTTTATITPTKPLLPGATYRVTVAGAIADLAGNLAVRQAGPAVRVSPKVDDSSKALGYAGTWRVLSASNALGGRYHGSVPTSSSPTSATVRVSGVGVAVYACLGPANGYLDVFVDGARKARVSTYRSYSGCGVKVAGVTGLSRGAHTVRLVGIGSRVSASRGNAVALDALVVAP